MPVLVGVALIGATYLIAESVAVLALFTALVATVLVVLLALIGVGAIGGIVVSMIRHPLSASLTWLFYMLFAGLATTAPFFVMYFVTGGHTSLESNHVHFYVWPIGIICALWWLVDMYWVGVWYWECLKTAWEGPIETTSVLSADFTPLITLFQELVRELDEAKLLTRDELLFGVWEDVAALNDLALQTSWQDRYHIVTRALSQMGRPLSQADRVALWHHFGGDDAHVPASVMLRRT
jgi:hypothetical protein